MSKIFVIIASEVIKDKRLFMRSCGCCTQNNRPNGREFDFLPIFLIGLGLYGDRYDSRKAVSDWDYHHGIKSKASIIHIKQV